MNYTRPDEVMTMPMTSVNVDAELLTLAKKELGVRTNREAINLALAEVAQKKRLLDGIQRMAEMDFEPNAEKIHYPLPSTVLHADA